MIRTLLSAGAVLACLTLGLTAAPLGAADGTPPPGFVALFGGKDFAHWKLAPGSEGHWVVKDGVIDYDGKSEAKGEDKNLWSRNSYRDLVLMVDWRWSGPVKPVRHPVILPNGDYDKTPDGKPREEVVMEAGDSGVYLRGSSKSQVNMWCWPIGSGEVYGYRTDSKQSPGVRAGVTPKKRMDKPIGEWNHMVITLKGDRLTVELNGEVVMEKAQLPGIPPSGPIALQHHGDPIQFKNIYIEELN